MAIDRPVLIPQILSRGLPVAVLLLLWAFEPPPDGLFRC